MAEGTQNLGTAVLELVVDESGMVTGLSRAQGSATAFTKRMKSVDRVGKRLTKFVTLPILAAAAGSVKLAADFETSLNTMQAVSGATAAQMKAVSQTAKDLGADVKLPATSAKDAAEAMTELAKGGLSAQAAMEAARGTLQLSAAAQIENAQAANIQVKALNAFKLEASDANRVADVLAATANASAVEITEVASSLTQASAVAHMAGFSIEDTATAIGLLANAGVAGSDAGTSLRTMLLRLQAPIGAGAKKIKELNLELRDQNGELKKPPALIAEFQSKLGGLNKAQKDAALAAIFGSDAIRGANILLLGGAANWDKMAKAVTRGGDAQRLAEAKTKGFNGAVQAMVSQLETAGISVGQALIPWVGRAVSAIGTLAEGFGNLSSGAQGTIITMALVAAGIGPVIRMVVNLAKAYKGLAAAMVFARANPVVLFAAAALGAGIAVVNFLNSVSRDESLVRFQNDLRNAKAAADGFKASMQGLKGTVDELRQANIDQVSAQLRVEQAQKNVTSALADAGRGSSEYRQAINELKQAQLDLERSTGRVTDAQFKAGKQAIDGAVELGRLITATGNAIPKGQQLTAVAQRLGQMFGLTKQEVVAYVREQRNLERSGATIDARYQAFSKTLLRAAKNIDTTTDAGKRTKATLEALAATSPAGVRRFSEVYQSSIRAGLTPTRALRDALASIKGKRVTVTVDNSQAIAAVHNLLATMAEVVSKQVTVTVNQKWKKGSPAAYEVPGILKQIQSKTVTVTVKAQGTAQLQGVGRGAARAIMTGVQQSKALIRQGITAAIKDSARSALSNAQQLGSSIASTLSDAIDKSTARSLARVEKATNAALARLKSSAQAQELAGLETGPEVTRIRAIDAAQQALADSRQEAELRAAIAEAETGAERTKAVEDLNNFILDKEKETLQRQLDERRSTLQTWMDTQETAITQNLTDQQNAIQAEGDARKEQLQRGINGLIDAYSRGLITSQGFTNALLQLIQTQAPEFNNLGDLLGGAFARGFADQLNALIRQIQFVLPRVGILPEISSPVADEIARLQARVEAMIKKARAKESPGGTEVTSAELTNIRAVQSKIKALGGRLADGGLVRGPVGRDNAGIFALSRGEGVFSAEAMSGLMAMMEGAKSGRGSMSVTVNLNGPVIGGTTKQVSRDLARLLKPELERIATA